MGNQVSRGKIAKKLNAKVEWLQKFIFISESKILPLIVQKQKK
jgi:hypothetical protein